MSETDSFIEEVSEEVRKDRLYGYIRRYGWIAITAVVLLVGGAAYNEYRKSQAQAKAQALGDQILAALTLEPGNDRVAKLGEITDAGDAAAVVTLLQAASVADDDAGRASAADALRKVISDASHPQIYRDLATLKLTILTSDETSADDRIAALNGLTVPGGAFRVLAEEQIALAELEKGEREAAISRLRGLLEDNEAGQGLRVRAQQLIVALGETLDPA